MPYINTIILYIMLIDIQVPVLLILCEILLFISGLCKFALICLILSKLGFPSCRQRSTQLFDDFWVLESLCLESGSQMLCCIESSLAFFERGALRFAKGRLKFCSKRGSSLEVLSEVIKTPGLFNIWRLFIRDSRNCLSLTYVQYNHYHNNNNN